MTSFGVILTASDHLGRDVKDYNVGVLDDKVDTPRLVVYPKEMSECENAIDQWFGKGNAKLIAFYSHSANYHSSAGNVILEVNGKYLALQSSVITWINNLKFAVQSYKDHTIHSKYNSFIAKSFHFLFLCVLTLFAGSLHNLGIIKKLIMYLAGFNSCELDKRELLELHYCGKFNSKVRSDLALKYAIKHSESFDSLKH